MNESHSVYLAYKGGLVIEKPSRLNDESTVAAVTERDLNLKKKQVGQVFTSTGHSN